MVSIGIIGLATILDRADKIASFLPKTEGAAGRIHLTRQQLDLIAKAGKSKGEMVSELLDINPNISSLDWAYKAKSNYSIGAFKVMEGKTPYMTGAVSIAEPGKFGAVCKARLSVGENGKIAQGSGFCDRNKCAERLLADNIDELEFLHTCTGSTEDLTWGELLAFHTKGKCV